MDAETLRMHIRQCRALTDKPFGVNIMLMNPAAPEMAKVVAEEGVKVVTTGAGLPTAYLPLWKEAGITVFPVVAASLVAKRLARSGIDGVIAEGCESGGHVGGMTTMALVPQVADAVDRAVFDGDVDTGSLMAGQVAGMLHEIRPLRAIFEDLWAGYQSCVKGLTER